MTTTRSTPAAADALVPSEAVAALVTGEQLEAAAAQHEAVALKSQRVAQPPLPPCQSRPAPQHVAASSAAANVTHSPSSSSGVGLFAAVLLGSFAAQFLAALVGSGFHSQLTPQPPSAHNHPPPSATPDEPAQVTANPFPLNINAFEEVIAHKTSGRCLKLTTFHGFDWTGFDHELITNTDSLYQCAQHAADRRALLFTWDRDLVACYTKHPKRDYNAFSRTLVLPGSPLAGSNRTFSGYDLEGWFDVHVLKNVRDAGECQTKCSSLKDVCAVAVWNSALKTCNMKQPLHTFKDAHFAGTVVYL
ncbi:hypothetical protein BC830DRAFT_1086147 [Chytriomyces sp. MP71]|nr:hypothetical protein BC830DRAFT_1086147 [Chytriomyces sp. MP71]